MLVRPKAAGRLSPAVARRVLSRLLLPQAQVEGVDFHLNDRGLAELASFADGFVLVMPPLGNLSNRFYAVHPRRNDRFVAARDPLKALFPEVDFTGFAFTGHVLGTLAVTCPERFAEVRRDLAGTWGRRMQALLGLLPRRGVLIDLPTPAWLARPPLRVAPIARIRVDPDDRVAGAESLRACFDALKVPPRPMVGRGVVGHSLPVSSGTTVNRSPTRP